MKIKTLQLLLASLIAVGAVGCLSQETADYKITKDAVTGKYVLKTKLKSNITASCGKHVDFFVCPKKQIFGECQVATENKTVPSSCYETSSMAFIGTKSGTTTFVSRPFTQYEKCSCLETAKRDCTFDAVTDTVTCPVPLVWVNKGEEFKVIGSYDAGSAGGIRYALSPTLKKDLGAPSGLIIPSTTTSSSPFGFGNLSGGSVSKTTILHTATAGGGAGGGDADVPDAGVGDPTDGTGDGTGDIPVTGDPTAGGSDTTDTNSDGTDVVDSSDAGSDEAVAAGDSAVVGDGFSDPSEHFVAGVVGGSGCSLVALQARDFSPDFLMAIGVIALIAFKGMYGTKRK